MKTVTQWFMYQQPVHVGDYQWAFGDSPAEDGYLWHWNGQQWGFYDACGSYHTCILQSPTWRGLAENPNGRSA
jgi:hypothetical protein